MKVTILGNNSALPAFGRHPTSQAVSVNGDMILLDCGEGTQIQMQRYGVRWRNINHIFISHLHGDHYFGLPGLINSMSLLGRQATLHLYAPAPLEGILNAILQVADTVLSFNMVFHPLPEHAAVLADEHSFTVSCFPVVHRIACMGFLIEKKTRGRRILPAKCEGYNIPPEYFELLKMGEDLVLADGTVVKNNQVTEDGPKPKRYAYTADTVFTDSFIHHIMDVDVLYNEATYLEADVQKAIDRFHCTAIQAATIAKLSRAKKLILGHFSSKYKELEPFLEEAATVFPDVSIGVEGMSYEI